MRHEKHGKTLDHIRQSVGIEGDMSRKPPIAVAAVRPRYRRRRSDCVGELFEFDPFAVKQFDCIDVNFVMKGKSLSVLAPWTPDTAS